MGTIFNKRTRPLIVQQMAQLAKENYLKNQLLMVIGDEEKVDSLIAIARQNSAYSPFSYTDYLDNIVYDFMSGRSYEEVYSDELKIQQDNNGKNT